MLLVSALTKTTAAWAVGNAGALDTGAIAASTWYHAHEIKRPDTGIVDACISLSATTPTVGGNIPSAYSLSRRIGSMRTNGSSQWIKFSQLEDEVLWDVTAADAVNVTTDTVSHLLTMSVPTGIPVLALFHGQVQGGDGRIYFSSPDKSDESVLGGNMSMGGYASTGGSVGSGFSQRVRTNTLGQIRYKAFAASSVMFLNTAGWVDSRGRSA